MIGISLQRSSPAVKTTLLAAGLTLFGVGLAARPSAGALVELNLWPGGPVAVLLAAALFCAAELHLLHTEFRRQAYSFTLAGVPLVLALLLLPGRDAIAARLLGAAVAFAIQQPAPLKAGYNLAAYTFEAALDLVILHLLLGVHPAIDVATGVTAASTAAAVDLSMSALVLLVITFHQGKPSNAECRAVLLPAVVFSFGCSTIGLVAVLLLRYGVLGLCLLLGAGAILTGGYRGYQVLHRRHEALTLVHQFVTDNAAIAGFDELASRLLSRARSLLRAGVAELILPIADGSVRLTVDEHGDLHTGDCEELDWLLRRVQETGDCALLPRSTRDAALKKWLKQRGVSDGLIVPLPSAEDAPGIGLLIMVDRLGDTSTFTDEDLRLLQTVAAHLAVALRNTQLIERLRHDAHHDALTGLANRALFNERLETTLSNDGGDSTAVLLLDLDKFKEVNDTLGHHVGDELLVVLGQRLIGTLPTGSVVCRLGGDEFAVLLTGLADPQGQATSAAKRIAKAMSQPVVLAEAVLSTQVSIGIGFGAADIVAADMLRHADTAMYAAKATGSGCVVYTAELDHGRAERLALLADLHIALERDELVLRYQPKLDLRSGRITSAEALVRWQHPKLGLVGPDIFIPLAESTGLIEELTTQVLKKALNDCRSWHRAGLDLGVAVNLSGRSISDPTLPERIGAALADAGVPAERLILEITEGSALAEAAITIPILNRLTDIGVTLSLDDFGTGYSSLAYLHRLPVSEVKIDKSFVQGLTKPESKAASEALIASTVSIARTLNLRTVAEGIEDDATLDQLRSMGVNIAQGYLIGRPGSSEDLQARARPTLPTQERRLTLLSG